VFRKSTAKEFGFFIGGEKGALYYIDDKTSKQCGNLGEFAPLASLTLWKDRDMLVAISKTAFLYKFSIAMDGKLEQQKKVSTGSKRPLFSKGKVEFDCRWEYR
jgi:hypothetical protein